MLPEDPFSKPCNTCDGRGALENSEGEFKKCPVCDGTGRVPLDMTTRW